MEREPKLIEAAREIILASRRKERQKWESERKLVGETEEFFGELKEFLSRFDKSYLEVTFGEGEDVVTVHLSSESFGVITIDVESTRVLTFKGRGKIPEIRERGFNDAHLSEPRPANFEDLNDFRELFEVIKGKIEKVPISQNTT